MGKNFICDERTVVTTAKGKLRGFYYNGIYTFHGIRYAKAKRFQAPQPVAAWEGVKDAISYGYICPILDQPRPAGEVATPHRFWPANENCQYLNIWTGSLEQSAKKPVMVWLHGGGFASGSSIEQESYDGHNLAAYGDVVLVSVNHRLNVFGHLDMSSFGPQYANSVNAGIADLVAALQWVKENIAAFGGNPDNVTIFGQSGGGSKVTALGQTAAADGLFHKAVIMSGVLSDAFMFSNADHREFALKVMEQLGIEDQDPEKLEHAPAQHLIEAVNAVSAALAAEGKILNWGPQPNDWYMGDPLKVGFAESFKKIPTMVGTVLGEFNMEAPIFGKETMTDEEKHARIEAKFGENTDEVIRRFKVAYPHTDEIYVLNYDTLFRPDTVAYIKKKAAEGTAPVYSYMFSNVFDYMGGKVAWHCSDIAFWFHNAGSLPVCQMDDGVTERLEAQMSMSLVNFARTGNPNTAGLPWWTPCNKEHMYTMQLDKQCEERADFEDELLPYMLEVTPAFHFDPSMFKDEEEEGSAWVY
ncbi:MAG: carboxylesterase family protein [Eubacteriales bacterium]|nr:carboxylesterase family protein [Eubacteriales bacterium]